MKRLKLSNLFAQGAYKYYAIILGGEGKGVTKKITKDYRGVGEGNQKITEDHNHKGEIKSAYSLKITVMGTL